MSAYARLERRFARIADIQGALAVLSWDREAMMPAGGAEARAEQMATLSELAHDGLIAADTGDLLAAAEAEASGLNPWQSANLREMQREHRRATAVDPALVGAMARATSKAVMVWRDARPAADFKALAPALAEVLRLTGEQASALGSALELAPYDALLDGYEPGLRGAEVDAILLPLADFLPGFLAEVEQAQAPAQPRPGPFPVAQQQALGRLLMARLGFDFSHGRLDESAHPFCGGIADDVRITARYDEADAASGLMAILHETGHALYSAGLPKDWRRQPVGQDRGMALHESQSLLIEMQVCRSRPFMTYLAPLLRQHFGATGADFAPDALYRQAIRVERGFIRVDADEVTYPLHVVLRYRLERALLAGDLAVADLPGAWRDGMQELLGITPPDDRLGCLQDIHWPIGAIGYFPCYTLGAVLAAQLFQAATAAEPAILPGIEQGDFAPLLGWLRRSVHGHGSRYELPELVRLATGQELALQPFLDHLQARYLS